MRQLPSDSLFWDKVMKDTYGLIEHKIENDDGIIKLFEKRSFFKGYCATAPYFTDGGINISNRVSEKTVDSLKSLLNEFGFKYLLFKTRENFFQHYTDFIVDQSFVTFMLDLTAGEENVWQEKLKSKTRNQTRKGMKCKHKVEMGHSDLLDDFYHVISICWRDLGTPVHSKNFFKNILNYFDTKARLIVIYIDEKPVSTALLLLFQDTIYHPYAATIKEYNRLSINNLLYWRIIEFGCKERMDWFDMGRSPINKGTYRYKSSWGAKPVQLYYTYLADKTEHIPHYFESKTLQLATTMWKKVPLPLTKMLGPKLIKGVL